MISYLQEVGRGKRGARDLSYEEARHAAELLVSGAATPAQTGAFLIAERIKMESTDELLAFVHILQSHARIHPVKDSFDCAGPYDGRTKSFMATLPTAFVLCACGLPTTLHSSAPLPPKLGVTLHSIMQLLKVNLSEEALKAGAAKMGLLYVPTEQWCPPLAALRSIREQLGMRTVFNSAEKLIGFSNPSSIALGVFHGTVFEKMAALLERLGYRSGIVVQGMEGSEDLTVEKRTRTMLIKNGFTDLYIVDPDVLGLVSDVPEREWTPALQLETTLAALRGDAAPVWRNIVILNSAIRLWTAGVVTSIEEGIDRSRSALQHGSALRMFLRWLEVVRLH